MITRLRLWIARRIAPFPLVQISSDLYEPIVVDISDDSYIAYDLVRERRIDF